MFEDYSPTALKWLLPDGSIISYDGVEISGANTEWAKRYADRSPTVAKWLLPDGSITYAMPIQDHSDYIQLDTNLSPSPTATGALFWDKTDETASINLTDDVTLQIGQEMYFRCVNKTGSIIPNGKLVTVVGATGNRPKIELASVSNYEYAIKTLGMTTHDIDNNEEGYVTVFGLVRGLNTQGITEGTSLYLSSVAGEYTTTKPTAPTACLRIGSVIVEHVNNGVVGIRPMLYKSEFGDIDGGNYSYFEPDGTFVNVGNATTFDDVLPSSIAVGTTGSNVPTFTSYNGNLKAYEFHGVTNMKEINLGFQMPHRRKANSNALLHLHLFIPNDASGGIIKFGCEYTWTNINQVGAVATTTIYGTLTITANQGILNNHLLIFSGIDGTNKGLSSMLMIRLFRDPTDSEDTFGSSVWLKSADLHIESDTLGSRSEYTK